MKNREFINLLRRHFVIAVISVLIFHTRSFAVDYPVNDTGQDECYSNDRSINPPEPGEAFFGQDAQYNELQLAPAYRNNEDGTISDLNTGLMWIQERGEKISWDEAIDGADECRTANYDDWRMPTIKELYSLIDFRGNNKPTIEESTPFIDVEYFDFEYGDEDQGERIIDCQDWSATEYVHFTMNNDSTVFGVNFADGRIKGYPKLRRDRENVSDNKLHVRYVRGNSRYGINQLTDNGDNTISDEATGLMWSKYDSDEHLNWEEALAWVGSKNENEYLGYSDWRLPNAKELQSIVDYTRAPSVTNSAAIDSVLDCTPIENEDGEEDYPFYWTNTTHVDGPTDAEYSKAVYVCFGRASGWMQLPPQFEWMFLDVHGAGAQRSDPKEGNPDDFPHGFGPQGDVIRIYNYVRLVRGQSKPHSVNDNHGMLPYENQLFQNYPNPFNGITRIEFILKQPGRIVLEVFDQSGQKIQATTHEIMNSGTHTVELNLTGFSTGTYFYRLENDDFTAVRKMIFMK